MANYSTPDVYSFGDNNGGGFFGNGFGSGFLGGIIGGALFNGGFGNWGGGAAFLLAEDICEHGCPHCGKEER